MSKEEPYYYLAPVDDGGKEGRPFCSVDFSLEPEATPERAVRELVEEARIDAIKRRNGAESGEARYRIVDRDSGPVKDFRICWRAEAIDEPESDSAKVDR